MSPRFPMNIFRRRMPPNRRGGRVKVETIFGIVECHEDDLVTQQLRDYGAHTRPELAFLCKIIDSGDRVFDIGAHIGTFTIPLARRVGPAGGVVAVEAQDENFALLMDNVVANGVGEIVTPVKAVVAPRDSTYAPAYERRNSGATRFVRKRPLHTRGERALGIDDIAARSFVPDAIKIDIEGLELQVLEDSQMVKRHRPILYAEVSAPQLGRYNGSIQAFGALLRRLDYRLFKNGGERNAAHDRFEVVELRDLSEGGAFFDVLAVPLESTRLARMKS